MSGKSKSKKNKQSPSEDSQQPLFKQQESSSDSDAHLTESSKSEATGQKPTNHGVQDYHLLGAENELRAQAWYLRRGYHVYIPVVQQGCIDFIAHKDGEYVRVEVKTASHTVQNTGSRQFGCCIASSKRKFELLKENDMFDILFVVHEEDCWALPLKEISVSYLTLASPSRGYYQQFKKYREFI